MKNLVSFLILFFLISCNQNKKAEVIQDVEEKNEALPEFLVGSWMLNSNSAEEQTFEHWTKDSKMKYYGHGFTLSDEDTVFNERMQLRYKSDQWILEITGSNDRVDFVIDQIKEDSFTAVNLENDFPTHIHYERASDTLKASIYDTKGDQQVDFIFLPRVDF